jgi:hypothetical protein
VEIKWFGLLLLLSRWVRFKSWWNFNSIKLGWRAVGMHLIGRSMFFCDEGRTKHRSGSLLLWFRKNDVVWFVIASRRIARGVLGLTSRLGCLQWSPSENEQTIPARKATESSKEVFFPLRPKKLPMPTQTIIEKMLYLMLRFVRNAETSLWFLQLNLWESQRSQN